MHWFGVVDGDPRAVGLFHRHYSCTNRKADHVRYGFSGNGESMILMTQDCLALFAWRKQKLNDAGQSGIECTVFRNEGQILSSELIKEADELAWQRWDDARHYTYVNPKKIRSTNPGYCFLEAGWGKCGTSKKGLVILEKVRRLDAAA